jgi:membrane protease YdiL (CAAX protease family)
MREPDALDALRILALALLARGAIFLAHRAGVAAELAGVSQQLMFFALPLLYAKAAGLRPLASSGFVRMEARQVALVLFASLGSFWLLYGLTLVQTEVIRAAGYDEKAKKEEAQIRETIVNAQKQGALPAISLLVLIPPLCEETFFRGILFRGLSARLGVGVALAGSSLLFAYFHQTIVQTVLMVFLGCYFGSLIYLTGSLWAGIIAHAANNLAVLTLTWVYGTGLQDFTVPAWMYLFSTLVFALAMSLLWIERRPART